MTEDNMQVLRDDIAFMRDLAYDGSSAPLLFGGVMVAAGLIFGIASIGHWLIASGVLQLPPWWLLANWLTAAGVFGVACAWLVRRAGARPGSRSGANRATGAAWSGVGFAIFASWTGLAAMGVVTRDWRMMNAFPVLILALYGAAWFVAGEMSRQGWIKLVALAAFVGAVVVGALATSPHLMLAYAAWLVLVAVVPGIVLMRREPAATA
jgi:hypothetical protein